MNTHSLRIHPFVAALAASSMLSCARPAATSCPEAPAAGPAPIVEAPPAKAPVSAAGVVSEVVGLINAGDAATLHARFGAQLQAAVPLETLQGMLAAIVEQRGKLTGSAPIEATERAGTFALTAERGAWKLEIVLGEHDVIAGLRLAEPDGAAPPVARSAPAGLPFRGEWSVFWGGERAEDNHHVSAPSQRRAADLVIVDEAGKTHRGDGTNLKDYYAYGQDILAMADGVVVTAVDGVPDSVPGELNAYFVPGNLVVVRHEGTVHSAYAHLIPGSLKVKPGDRVRRGQVLGKCGNSGNSSEPHLHVQFQDGPRFERSWGIEAVFAEAQVVRGGARERRTDYTLLKGDRVSAVPRR